MITSKTLRKILNTTLSKDLLKILRNSNITLLVLCVAILAIEYGYVIKNMPDEPVSINRQLSPTMAGSEPEEQDLSKLLETKNPPPEIVKCNFSGTYEVTQDSVHPQNGAKCSDFEYRAIKLNNITAECQSHLDPKQELFLDCKNPTNPVTTCNGIVRVESAGKPLCEYWVTVKRIY